MSKEQKTLQLGIDATQVLDNEAFKQAMTQLKEAVVWQWKECPVRDREGQMLLLQLAKHRIDLDNLRDESKVRGLLRKIA